MLRFVFIFCIGIAIIPSNVYIMAIPSPRDVRVSLVREHSSPRTLRAIKDSNLPDELDFELAGVGEDVIGLRLRRSALVPVATSEGWSSTGQTTEDAGVYTDPASGGAFIVRRHNGHYNRTGLMIQDNETVEIRPVTRHVRDLSNHVIARISKENHVISFSNDMFVVSSGLHVQIIDILDSEGIPQSRKRRAVPLDPDLDRLHSRTKRSPVQNTVEVAMIADYSDYQAFKNYYGALSAVQEMTLWYTYVSEAIRIRYESIVDYDIAITTTVTILKIITNENDDFIRGLVRHDGKMDSATALDAVIEYAKSQTPRFIPISDHYMLFTQALPGLESAIGVAYVSQVCTFNAVSISHNTFDGAIALIAAHELGHSLGSVHDGDTFYCTDKSYYVMATRYQVPIQVAGNAWRFSTCSTDAFKEYLRSVTCTLPEHTSSGPSVLPSGSKAGQALDRDAQCKLHYEDSSSFFCENAQKSLAAGIEGLCGAMYCWHPTDPGDYCYPILPQEFTTCNDDKWCVAGYCVSDSVTEVSIPTLAPRTTTSTAATTTELTATCFLIVVMLIPFLSE